MNVVKVVTFGAPKLGPRETREAAETLNILRVVQKDDIIPLLPMSRPFVRKPYVHLGEGVMLDNDTPGRYANLTNEWGTAGILWRQQAHLGYASGKMDRAAVAVEEDRGGGGLGRGRDVDVLVSADDADAAIGSVGGVGTGIGEEREGRWASARKRLASLRANLREGIATRVARAGEVVVAATPGVGVGGVVAAASASVAAKSGDASAAANAFNLQALPMSENEWAAEVAEWAHAPHENSAATSASLSTSDPAPFDDVEGELFVRLAETEGGAGAAAAAAATEWEKATSRADAAESDASVSAVAAVAAANNIVAASDQIANDRAGPDDLPGAVAAPVAARDGAHGSSGVAPDASVRQGDRGRDGGWAGADVSEGGVHRSAGGRRRARHGRGRRRRRPRVVDVLVAMTGPRDRRTKKTDGPEKKWKKWKRRESGSARGRQHGLALTTRSRGRRTKNTYENK